MLPSRVLEESSTYRAIIEKGLVEGMLQQARRMLVRLGTLRLGKPSQPTLDAIATETNRERIELWIECLSEAISWDEALAVRGS